MSVGFARINIHGLCTEEALAEQVYCHDWKVNKRRKNDQQYFWGFHIAWHRVQVLSEDSMEDSLTIVYVEYSF